MRRIKLMADYFAFPLWDAEGGGLASDTLPLSAPLVADLEDRAELHDSLLGPAFAWPSQNAQADFVAQGRRLFGRVRDELGSAYEVVYFDELTGRVETR